MSNDPFNQNPALPDPSQMSMGYNYNQQGSQQYNPSYSNMMYMNMNQSQLQQTMQIAQSNFHDHMQSVLQGTMAAGMSIYGQAQKVGSAFQERAYNDLYFGGGNFALERSTWRDMTWGSGLAGSDFGRTFKIGGRRPEFVSPEEYDFTMQRSWGHRKEELLDQIVSGGSSAASSVSGMYLTRPLGMLRGIGAGMMLDATVGNVISSNFIRPREYARDFREYTEVADFNHTDRIGRMSEDVSNRYANMMYNYDGSPKIREAFGFIPLVGDYLGKAVEKRLSPDTSILETTKKMQSLGLLRDVDPNDLDKIQSQVKNTITIIEKFAGLANTTKDAILKMKASFNDMGFNGGQQDTLLGNLTKTAMSTGIHIDQLLPMAQTYATMGYNSSFNKSIVAQSGLNELSAIKAMQEYGLIDRMQDAGTLSQMHLMTAQNFVKSGWGKVSTFGDGNTAAAANYYRSRGGGNSAIGMTFEDIDGYAPDVDPIAAARGGWLLAKQRLGGGLRGTAGVIAAFGGSREEKNQIYNSIYGLDELGEMHAAGSAAMDRAKKTGVYNNVASFNVLDYNGSYQSNNEYTIKRKNYFNSIIGGVLSAESYNRGDNSSYDARKRTEYFTNHRRDGSGGYGELYNLIISGANEGITESKRKQIIENSLKTGMFSSREEAERGLNLALKDMDSSRGSHWYTSRYDLTLKDTSDALNGSPYKSFFSEAKDLRNGNNQNAYSALSNIIKKDDNSINTLVSLMKHGKNDAGLAVSTYLNQQLKNGKISRSEMGTILESLKNKNGDLSLNNELAFSMVSQSLGDRSYNVGIGNYYNIMKARDSYHYGDSNGQINEKKLGDHVGDFKSQITGLKGMSGAQMRDWIHGKDGQKYLGQNLRAIYGEERGSKLWSWFNEQSQNDPEAFRKKFMDTFVNHGAIVSDADFKKAGIDMTTNPNTVALNEFTKALTALNRVLGAT